MQKILKKTAAGNYTAESVKEYVKELKNLYDIDFNEMRERMIALRDDNRRLKEELDELQSKEKYIASTVLKAEQMAQHICEEAEIKAQKRINEAEGLERQAKAKVTQSVEQLYAIQRSIAILLNHVIDTTTAIKENGNVQEPVFRSASDIFQFVSGIKQPDSAGETQHMAV